MNESQVVEEMLSLVNEYLLKEEGYTGVLRSAHDIAELYMLEIAPREDTPNCINGRLSLLRDAWKKQGSTAKKDSWSVNILIHADPPHTVWVGTPLSGAGELTIIQGDSKLTKGDATHGGWLGSLFVEMWASLTIEYTHPSLPEKATATLTREAGRYYVVSNNERMNFIEYGIELYYEK